MSTRESHRRRARRYRTKVQRAEVADQMVMCEKCGLPVLYQECFESCWQAVKPALMTDVPNWEHMDMAVLGAELDRRNGK